VRNLGAARLQVLGALLAPLRLQVDRVVDGQL
jgi:hypothetical protein